MEVRIRDEKQVSLLNLRSSFNLYVQSSIMTTGAVGKNLMSQNMGKVQYLSNDIYLMVLATRIYLR
jgi:hypothetical protein